MTIYATLKQYLHSHVRVLTTSLLDDFKHRVYVLIELTITHLGRMRATGDFLFLSTTQYRQRSCIQRLYYYR